MSDSTDNAERHRVVAGWTTLLKKAIDYDVWGQPVEASDCYHKLATSLQSEVDFDDSVVPLSQKKLLRKVIKGLEMRRRELKNPAKKGGVRMDELYKIDKALSSLCGQAAPGGAELELDLPAAEPVNMPDLTTGEYDVDRALPSADSTRSRGLLLDPPNPVQGKSMLTVHIDRIGLKDYEQYLDPFITISVKDSQGVDLTAIQDTPLAQYKADNHIYFGDAVHIQKPIEVLPTGFAIMFEFKHYKPKKKMVSTKCWAFIEKDEICDGHKALELYKKPTDPRRKHVYLVTMKDLFLHISLVINR